jgi:hypothetical protein
VEYPVKFKVKNAVTGDPTPVNPDSHLAIGPDLTEAMMRQPGLFAYYAALAEEEYRRGKRIKFKLHCLKEDLDERFRKEATKRLTERELSNKINKHPKMRLLYEKYVATMRRAGHLKVIKDAFDQRYHMLQSIGANRRKEQDVDLRTLKQAVKLKSHKER